MEGLTPDAQSRWPTRRFLPSAPWPSRHPVTVQGEIATTSENVAAIVSYEPGAYLYPEGEVPPDIPRADGMSVSPGRGIPLADFLKLTKMPIQVVWGDFIPSELDPVNVGPRLLDLDNAEIADLLSDYLREKDLDRRGKRHGRHYASGW
ncbi:MAG: hypothetical protein ACREMX_10275 [Gemmatimonadales bacterium]